MVSTPVFGQAPPPPPPPPPPTHVVPTVTINMDSANAYDIAKSLQVINQTLNPQLVAPQQIMPDNDPYGTPFEWTLMPDTWDTKSQLEQQGFIRVASPMSMIAMRMKWGPYKDSREVGAFTPLCPFNHMTVHISEEKALVFIVNNGQPVVLEDDKALFPSDKLIGQIRVLEASAQNPTK